MSALLNLFRGSDRSRADDVSLNELLRESLRGQLGGQVDAAHITLWLIAVPDDDPPGGPPVVHNLTPEFGYANVEVRQGGRMIYRHPHTIEELIARPLRARLLREHPEEKEWTFAFAGVETRVGEARVPEPPVRGTVEVQPYSEGESAPFGIRRRPDPIPDQARLADFGLQEIPAFRHRPVKVLIHRTLCDDLLRRRPFSPDVEEGGFLLGHVFEDREAPKTYLAVLTGAPPGRHTGASLLHFTFTGDSFEAVKRHLRENRSGERLLGWYHTHLFAAAEEMGLSSIDLRLHFTTFLQPWQLAGLVNIEGGTRALRFYVRREDTMELCPQWVLE